MREDRVFWIYQTFKPLLQSIESTVCNTLKPVIENFTKELPLRKLESDATTNYAPITCVVVIKDEKENTSNSNDERMEECVMNNDIRNMTKTNKL